METYEFPPGSPEAERLRRAAHEVAEARRLAQSLELQARTARRELAQAQQRFNTLLLELGGQERLPFDEGKEESK